MPLIFLYFLNMKIIIIALSGIGDSLMFTPALKLLRAQLPDAQIDALVMFKGAQDILIKNPNINDVYRFDFLLEGSVKSLKYILSLRGKYDTSINVYPSNRKEYNIMHICRSKLIKNVGGNHSHNNITEIAARCC